MGSTHRLALARPWPCCWAEVAWVAGPWQQQPRLLLQPASFALCHNLRPTSQSSKKGGVAGQHNMATGSPRLHLPAVRVCAGKGAYGHRPRVK